MEPMKILQIGWGWPPVQGGGVINYTKYLSEELVKAGHQVTYLYTGDFNLWPLPYLKTRHENGVKIISLKNSPNGYLNFGDPLHGELENKKIEKIFVKILQQEKPKIVHIQNLMGLSASIIKIIKKQNIPLIISFHNYWFVCPRVELFKPNATVCQNWKAGENCAGCVPNIQPATKIFNRYKIYLRKLIARHLPKIIKNKLEKKFNKSASQITQFSGNSNKDYIYRNQYLKKILLEDMNLGLAVSSFVKKILLQWGIPDQKILVQPIGTKAAQFIHPLAKNKHEGVTFGYIGPFNRWKGLNLIIEAFSKLNNPQAKLIIYGGDENKYREIFGPLPTEKGNWEFRGGYEYTKLSEILTEIDVGIVPPVWYDNAPQVVFEFLAAKTPVIGANIGGIPDFIQHEKNGLLFVAGNTEDLIKKINYLMENKNLISLYRENIPAMKTMADHAKEMEKTYAQLS